MSLYQDLEGEKDHRFYKNDQLFEKKRRKSILGSVINILLAVFIAAFFLISFVCCLLITYFHSHILLECSYAELMTMLLLELTVIFFCLYHAYGIIKFFLPRKNAKKNLKDSESVFTKEGESTDIVAGGEDEEEEDDSGDFENSLPMKILFIVLKAIGLILSVGALLLLILFTITVVSIQLMATPQYSGVLSFDLKGKTSIKRDWWGVIHIVSQNLEDMYFAQGVASAQERMWELELFRRNVEGTLSEVLGEGALTADKMSRTLGIFKKSQADADYIKDNYPKEYLYLQRYADGINSYTDMGSHYPPEFLLTGSSPGKWTVAHLVGFQKFYAWDLATDIKTELTRFNLLKKGFTVPRINTIIPPISNDTTTLSLDDLNIVLPPGKLEELNAKFRDESGAYIPPKTTEKVEISQKFPNLVFGSKNSARRLEASNGWVISGNYTTTGKPILANDPHLGLQAPIPFILFHLNSAENNYDAMGSAFACFPGIISGKSATSAWGVTNGASDTQDLFVMTDVYKSDPNVPDSYMKNGAEVIYEKRTETINVKGKSPIQIFIMESEYGPVINDLYNMPATLDPKTKHPKLSLFWPVIDKKTPDTSAVGSLRVSGAKNYQAFKSALELLIGPAINVLFAESEPNLIAYQLAGKHMIRKRGHSGRFPVPGDGTFDYEGSIPYSELPASVSSDNCQKTATLHCSSAAFFANSNNRIEPPGYPYGLGFAYGAHYRVTRVREMINGILASRKIDGNDVKAMQLDTTSQLFKEFRFVFDKMRGNVSADAEEWRKKVAAWDGIHSEGNSISALFEMWIRKLPEVFAKEVGETVRSEYPFYKSIFEKDDDPACTALGKACIQFAAQIFDDAYDRINEDFGGTAPSWGNDIHLASFDNPVLSSTPLSCLASRSIFTVGGTDTVNVATTELPDLQTSFGPNFRNIIQLGSDATTPDYFILALGQSGNWLTPFYANFMGMWRSGNYLKMEMTTSDQYYNLQLH